MTYTKRPPTEAQKQLKQTAAGPPLNALQRGNPPNRVFALEVKSFDHPDLARLLLQGNRFRCGSHNLPNDVGRRQGPPTSFQRSGPKCHAQGDLGVGDEFHLVFLSVPLYSMFGTGISTCSLGLLKLCRNLCGKRTCALLSFVSENACASGCLHC